MPKTRGGGSAFSNVSSNSLSLGIATKTSAYTLTGNDYTILADATTGAFTVTLPVAPAHGMLVNVKKIDASANVVTINGNGRNIDRVATRQIGSQDTNSQMQYDSSSNAWYVL